MMLRAWILLLVMGLAPAAEAAGALFHLCRGSVQFDATCCCNHKAKWHPDRSAASLPFALADSKADGCCSDFHLAQSSPAPASPVATGEMWRMAPALALPAPALPAVSPPIASELRSTKRGALDPPPRPQPLFVQHCSFLI